MLHAAGKTFALDFHAVGVAGPKCRDLDDFAAHGHVHNTKTAADDACIAEFGLDLLRRGIRGHIEILGLYAQQQVPDGATDNESFIPGIIERVEYAQAARADMFAGNAVLVAVENDGGQQRSLAGGCRMIGCGRGFLAQNSDSSGEAAILHG